MDNEFIRNFILSQAAELKSWGGHLLKIFAFE